MTGHGGSWSGSSWRSTGGSPARLSPPSCEMSRLPSEMNAGMPCWPRWPSILRQSTISRRRAGLSCGCCVGRGSRPSFGCSALTPWSGRQLRSGNTVYICRLLTWKQRDRAWECPSRPGTAERAFTALGDRLVRRGVVADVFVVGGAPMALAYDAWLPPSVLRAAGAASGSVPPAFRRAQLRLREAIPPGPRPPPSRAGPISGCAASARGPGARRHRCHNAGGPPGCGRSAAGSRSRSRTG